MKNVTQKNPCGALKGPFLVKKEQNLHENSLKRVHENRHIFQAEMRSKKHHFSWKKRHKKPVGGDKSAIFTKKKNAIASILHNTGL